MKYKYFLIAIAVFYFSSCKKDNKNPEEAVNFYATKNGKSWNTTGRVLFLYKNTFAISIVKKIDGLNEVISFGFSKSDVSETGTIQNLKVAFLYMSPDDYRHLAEYKLSSTDTRNFFKLTSIDTVKKQIEGEFLFVFEPIKTSAFEKQILFENGKFKMPYIADR